MELTHIFPVRNAGIGLITADKESLEIVAFHSADSEEKSALGMILLLVGNSATQEVIENKKTVVVQNLQKDDGTKPMAGVSQIGGTKALMIVPLMKRGTVIGTIGKMRSDWRKQLPFRLLQPLITPSYMQKPNQPWILPRETWKLGARSNPVFSLRQSRKSRAGRLQFILKPPGRLPVISMIFFNLKIRDLQLSLLQMYVIKVWELPCSWCFSAAC